MDSKRRRSSPVVLGSLAGTDLLLRAVAAVPWTRLGEVLDWVGQSVLASLAIALLSNATGSLRLVGVLAQWGLYVYLVYAFAPRLYPRQFGEWPAFRGARMLTTAVALWTVLGFTTDPGFLGTDPATWLWVTIAAGGLLFASYLQRHQRQPFDAADGYVHAVLTTMGAEAIDGTEHNQRLTVDPTAETRGGRASGLFLLGLVGVILTFFCLLLGVLIWVLGLFFPLLELTVLAWSGYRLLADLLDVLPASSQTRLDVEQGFFGSLRSAFREPGKGLVTVLLVAFGLVVSAFPVLLFVSFVAAVDGDSLVRIVTTPRGLMGLFTFSGLVAFGLYGLWYWYLVVHRLPGFIASYSTGEPSTTDGRSPLPRTYTAPAAPTLLVSAAFTVGSALHLHQHPELDLIPLRLIAVELVGMLLALLVLLRTVYRTYGRDDAHTTPGTNHAITIGFLVQNATLLGFLAAVTNYERIKTAGLELDPALVQYGAFDSVLLLGVLLLVLLYYVPDATRYAETESRVRGGLALGGALGVLVLGSGALVAFQYSVIPAVGTVVVLGGLGAVWVWMTVR